MKQPIHFYKMHGSGNDFIIIDNRTLQLSVEKMPAFAQKNCQRAFGVGADGIIFLNHAKHPNNAYQWHFYNADGSRPAMCGNGSRCAAWLAVTQLELAEPTHQFQTDAGIVKATVYPKENRVKVLLTNHRHLKTNIINYLGHNLHFVNTGCPHIVIITDFVELIDPNVIGRQIRFHPLFEPQGTNVNFVQIIDRNHIYIRTYERGIEKEPYACGTGAAASVVIANTLGLTEKDVECITTEKEKIRIILDHDQVWLEGDTCLVYQGQI